MPGATRRRRLEESACIEGAPFGVAPPAVPAVRGLLPTIVDRVVEGDQPLAGTWWADRVECAAVDPREYGTRRGLETPRVLDRRQVALVVGAIPLELTNSLLERLELGG